MSDIMERLRDWPRMTPVACKEAADEIERLRDMQTFDRQELARLVATNERLTAALREIAVADSSLGWSIARAALEGK